MSRALSMPMLLLISSLVSPGCLRDHCDGAKPIPVQGSRSSYTLRAGEYPAATLSDPVACPDSFYVDGSLIVVVGRGGRKLASGLDGGCLHQPGSVDAGACRRADWSTFSSEVVKAHADLPWLGSGLGRPCGSALPAGCVHFITVRDWGATNAVVQTLLDELRAWDLGDCIAVIVSGQAVMCAD